MTDTYEVRRLLAQRESEDFSSRETAKRKLDQIANAVRFDGEILVGENGVDTDQLHDSLFPYGAKSFSEYMYCD